MKITDSQIHLWEADSPARPWPAGVKPDLAEPMTAERFIPMMDELGIARAVISPPGVSGFDPGYALDCARRYPDRLAVTSRWTLDDPEGPARLGSWLDQPGMIGIRFAIVPASAQRWREDGRLAQFWTDAARHDIPLMVFAPGTIAEIETAAAAHPGLKLVVDHANLVGSTPETVGERIADLVALARFPNVGVKLGSLPLRSAKGYPFDDLQPHLRRVFDAFGPQRLMWASDLTTSLAAGKATYRENLDMLREALAFASDEDMAWVLGGTVSDWFRWPQ